MRELVKVASLPEQDTKQIHHEVEIPFNDMLSEIPLGMFNEEDPDDITDEFDLFLLECTEDEELAELEKIVCQLNDLDDDAFGDDEYDAEEYIDPEETTVQHDTNKDSLSIEAPLDQTCTDNATKLQELNKDSVNDSLELESKVLATVSNVIVDKEADLQIKQSIETFKCSACIKGFTDEESFNEHMATHSNVTKRRSKTKQNKEKPKKSLTCEICYNRFTRKYNFVRHIVTHLNKRPYTCYLCQKVYQLRYRLVSHLRRHTEAKVFTCDKCSTNFRNKKNLIDHLQIHADEKRYTCDVCSARFAKKWYIQSHMRSHSEKRFECDICNSKFTTKRNLESHARIHSGEKPFACEQCPLTFADKSNLFSHIKTHTRNKFTCNICQTVCLNMFEYKRCFATHMKILAGDKLFTCLVCHNKFSKKSNLNTHMRTHTGEKPFACSVCDHKFARKNNLVCHMRSHTGVKPHVCKVCEKKFAHKRNLRDHLKTHENATH
ncbi:gastrula zinc finger protein XlCGF57.1-like [Maniola jurtina]|uniref:gastrula zinc finger protein XlCGF57.1-like n=1 Tax=Maniola jurtina TaxID=191418 RepID=UPI001E68D0D4|nr:gastrula zinc finger protein XlCGF57.1-like [Maniola jurtina]